MPPEDRRNLALSPNTLIPIGALVAITGVIVGFTSWLGDRFYRIESQLEIMRVERENTSAIMLSHWTKTEQELWAERLKSGNPSLVVPTIR